MYTGVFCCFLLGTAWAQSYSYTNCQNVYDHLFPSDPCEINRKCSGSRPACHVKKSKKYCEATCVPEDSCPEGFTFTEFLTDIACNTKTLSPNTCQTSLSSVGFACLPYTLQCDYRENSNLYVNLTIQVT